MPETAGERTACHHVDDVLDCLAGIVPTARVLSGGNRDDDLKRIAVALQELVDIDARSDRNVLRLQFPGNGTQGKYDLALDELRVAVDLGLLLGNLTAEALRSLLVKVVPVVAEQVLPR